MKLLQKTGELVAGGSRGSFSRFCTYGSFHDTSSETLFETCITHIIDARWLVHSFISA